MARDKISFGANGLLPLRDFKLTIDELKSSLLVVGDGRDAKWDREYRAHLVEALSRLLPDLKTAGIS